jgi:lipopolysaccharide transport system ATP-binding protein
MSDTVIQVENLGKQYHIGQRESYLTLRETITKAVRAPFSRGRQTDDGLFWALKDVSFGVKRGEVLGIIGRNGAGKSTLLKILTRITEPTEGRATIHGRVASLLEVGTGFHPELTGRENIFLNGAILGMSKREIDRKFDEIVAFSEIEKFLDTPVKRYSSGMYVRLAFAVAAHMEPEILLIDEVLAVGDAQFQKKCLGKMGDVAREGRTILFVSHNMAAIQRLCRTSLWLSDGRVVAEGPVGDVVSSYLSTTDSHAQVLSVEYPNDPGKPMQLLRANLRKPVNGLFSVPDELMFEVDLLTRTPIEGAYVTVNVLDNYDSPLYWTADIDTDRFKSPVPGCLRLVCRCPAYLLTPGRYSCNFGIVSLGLGTIDHMSERRITFEIEDNRSLLAVYGVRQPGVSAVPSVWSVQAESNSQVQER